MTSRLNNIVRGVRQRPPRIIIYGLRGVGKSSFCAKATNPIFVPTEDGLGVLDVAAFPLAKSFDELLANLASLANEDHEYKTVVLDSLDWCEKLIHEVVRKKEGERVFVEYGRGYTLSVAYIEDLLKALDRLRDEKGMTILITAHTIVKRFQSPDSEPYDRWELDLHQKAASVCEEWADVLLFASQKIFTTSSDVGFGNKQVRGVGNGERVLLTEERPSHVAKNRYSLPYELPLEYKALAKEIVKSWKKSEPAEVEE
jgi:GTPase SAR1 family protein